MDQLHSNNDFKILSVELPSGKIMPRHYATSDAFIIVNFGLALLILKNETVELKQGVTFAIPALEPHILKIVENFNAYIVMASNAEIKFFETS